MHKIVSLIRPNEIYDIVEMMYEIRILRRTLS